MGHVSQHLDDSERRALPGKARAATLDALRALGGKAHRDEIIDYALANGGFTPRELAEPAPKGNSSQCKRLVEYKLSFALSDLKTKGLLEKPEWGIWSLAGAALETPVAATEEQVDPQRLAELRTMPYKDYLRSREWQRTRAAALLRVGNCCSLDVTHTEHLDVHHRTYERRGEELASDLVVLCHLCHWLHHEQYGLPRRNQPPRFGPVLSATTHLSSTNGPQKRERSWLRRLLPG
jgi:Mrr N-terminal domain